MQESFLEDLLVCARSRPKLDLFERAIHDLPVETVIPDDHTELDRFVKVVLGRVCEVDVFVEGLSVHVHLLEIWQGTVFVKIDCKVVPLDILLVSKHAAQVLPLGHRERIDAFVEQAVGRIESVGGALKLTIADVDDHRRLEVCITKLEQIRVGVAHDFSFFAPVRSEPELNRVLCGALNDYIADEASTFAGKIDLVCSGVWARDAVPDGLLRLNRSVDLVGVVTDVRWHFVIDDFEVRVGFADQECAIKERPLLFRWISPGEVDICYQVDIFTEGFVLLDGQLVLLFPKLEAVWHSLEGIKDGHVAFNVLLGKVLLQVQVLQALAVLVKGHHLDAFVRDSHLDIDPVSERHRNGTRVELIKVAPSVDIDAEGDGRVPPEGETARLLEQVVALAADSGVCGITVGAVVTDPKG